MSHSPVHGDEADGPTLQAILEAVLDRNAAFERNNDELAGLSVILAENTAELRRTQNLLDKRPLKEDVAYHRRVAFATMIGIAFAIIFGHDQHVEHCGPGARAEAVIEAVANNEVTSFEATVERIQQTDGPDLCDYTFPLHTHDETRWPSQRNVIGLGVYLTLAAGLTGWVYTARHRMLVAKQNERSAQPRNRRCDDKCTNSEGEQ